MRGGARLATVFYTLVALSGLAYTSYNLWAYFGAETPSTVEGSRALELDPEVPADVLELTQTISAFIDGDLRAAAQGSASEEEGTLPDMSLLEPELSRLESRMRTIVRECSGLVAEEDEERERALIWLEEERSGAVAEVIELMERLGEQVAPDGAWAPVIGSLKEGGR